jgi:hypothetical protein
MDNRKNRNHGEGDPEAAARFNEAEQRFVGSVEGERAIRKGARVKPEEEAALKDAERRGKERAKGGDDEPQDDK